MKSLNLVKMCWGGTEARFQLPLKKFLTLNDNFLSLIRIGLHQGYQNLLKILLDSQLLDGE